MGFSWGQKVAALGGRKAPQRGRKVPLWGAGRVRTSVKAKTGSFDFWPLMTQKFTYNLLWLGGSKAPPRDRKDAHKGPKKKNHWVIFLFCKILNLKWTITFLSVRQGLDEKRGVFPFLRLRELLFSCQNLSIICFLYKWVCKLMIQIKAKISSTVEKSKCR